MGGGARSRTLGLRALPTTQWSAEEEEAVRLEFEVGVMRGCQSSLFSFPESPSPPTSSSPPSSSDVAKVMMSEVELSPSSSMSSSS